MKKHLYSVLELKFNSTLVHGEEVITSEYNLESSRLVGKNVIASVKDFIENCEKKGLTRRPFFFCSGKYLGDVFVSDKEPNTLLGLYRFEAERPGESVYIIDENFKRHSNSPLSVKRSEPITSIEEFIERSVESIEEHNERNGHWHKLGHARFFIGNVMFEKALPFPHNFGMYIEDKEKGLGR